MASLRRLLLIGLAALAALTAPSAGTAQPAAPADGAYRGYLAARLDDSGQMQVIDESHAGRLFVPASVLKLATVAAALEHLGADYQWVTRLTTRGAVLDGVLDGDLVIEPGADPTWGPEGGGDATPALLAGQVRARGITRIAGDLVVDVSRFPGRPHPLDREFGDLPYPHGTPPAALAVDAATIEVHVGPADTVGRPARVRAPEFIEVINHTTTVGRERHGSGTLDFMPVWGTDTLVLRGEYPVSEPAATVAVSDPAPVRRAAQSLRQALAAAGVALDGSLQHRARPVPASQRRLLAEHRSMPLTEVLEPILINSRNWYADMLILALGREIAGTGRFDDGVEVVEDFLAELPGLGLGAAPAADLQDGSGLSPTNLVTPAGVVRLLAHAARQPWGRALVAALPRPGAGTLAAWRGLPHLAAKTGTLRHTVALAGFLEPDSGAPVVFCYFVNHHPERLAAARREIAGALVSWQSAGR